MKIPVIDVGGTHVKVRATGQKTHQNIPSGSKMTAKEMVTAIRKIARLLKKLPSASRIGDNDHAFRGGLRLWSKKLMQPSMERLAH